MSKLVQHQLLAFENETKHQANTIMRETIHIFDKSSSFDEFYKSYQPFIDGDKDVVDTDKKLMTTTVSERLNFTTKYLMKSINILASKEYTNTLAKADIIIKDDEGTTIAILAKDVPVSTLLSLDKKFSEIRLMYAKIPTLNTEKHWVIGTNTEGIECYQEADSVKVIRTKTEIVTEAFNPNPISESEKYKLEPRDRKVTSSIGEYTTVNKTGRISPKAKADILERLDQVTAAIKSARAIANGIEVKNQNIGKDIFSYINSGT